MTDNDITSVTNTMGQSQEIRSLLSTSRWHESAYGTSLTYMQWRGQEFCSEGGGSTKSVEDRENGDLEAVAPWSGVLEAAAISYKKFNFI